MAFRGAKAGKFPEVESAVLAYVQDLRQKGLAVSCEIIQTYARQTARDSGIAASSFKASNGWTVRFMRRHGLSLRRRTTLCQRLPEDLEEKVMDFQRFVIRLRKEKGFILSQIGNADQTPLNYDMPASRTVHSKGDRSVTVRTSGAEKQRCTVMLAVTADGRKLRPYVIFKRKTIPKGTFPRGIHIRAHEKGWMSHELVVDWIATVWEKRPGGLLRLPALLVLDSYRGHLVEPVRNRLAECRTDMAVIPGGLTSVLQPLDVSINKPFKENIRRLYSEWMASEDHQLTATGKVKRPALQTVCEWIVQAWDMVPASVILKSFKVTGISSALDGTEDDLLWLDRCSSDVDEVSLDSEDSECDVPE